MNHLSEREPLELIVVENAESQRIMLEGFVDLLQELREIRRILKPHPITSFTIKETNMQPVAPGFSPQYTASVVPTGNVLDPKQPVPTWTSSDTTNAPVSADSTGLIGTVTIPAGATVGATFTLTVNYTNADGTTATGTLDQTIVAAPAVDVTGFTIAQSA